MFSTMNICQNHLRNCLDVSTGAGLLKIKSYYCEEKSLEITGKHLELYRLLVKGPEEFFL